MRICENAICGQREGAIIKPQCRNAAAALQVTITGFPGNKISYRLCNECADLVKADAQRCHYQFRSKKIWSFAIGKCSRDCRINDIEHRLSEVEYMLMEKKGG